MFPFFIPPENSFSGVYSFSEVYRVLYEKIGKKWVQEKVPKIMITLFYINLS